MKKILFTICLFIACITSTNAADLTPEQKQAQHNLIVYLSKIKYDPSIDTSDNSVCFRLNGVLHWITIEENSPILYTIHRKGYKISTENGYNYDLAVKAANEVNNQRRSLKLVVLPNKVDVTIPVYASKTEEFTNAFEKNLSMFGDVDALFKKEYQKAKKTAAPAAESPQRQEPEAQHNLPPSELANYIKGISFRLINPDGSERTKYDAPMRRYDAHYIQPRFTFANYNNKEPKQYTVYFKFYKPDGTLIEAQGSKYTSEALITLSKSKKDIIIEIPEFGTESSNFWKAGEYKVECIESESVFYTTSFTLL